MSRFENCDEILMQCEWIDKKWSKNGVRKDFQLQCNSVVGSKTCIICLIFASEPVKHSEAAGYL